jgi:hypothetical protein
MFKAYKYIKSQRIEKLPVIISNGQRAVIFEKKCSIFLRTLFPEPPTAPEAINWNNYRISRKWKWKFIINTEIKEAIFFSAIRKASGLNGISFTIIRKAYNIIPDIFNALFRNLLMHEFHPLYFKKVIGAILKKSDRNPTLPKFYRIIALLNYLAKISEKIIATKLAQIAEITDLLHYMQIGGRKGKSAIDVAIILMYEIQRNKSANEITSVLFMDIKGAFDHVSLDQLLRICQKLGLPFILCKWINSFMTNRIIQLKFDGKTATKTAISTGIL